MVLPNELPPSQFNFKVKMKVEDDDFVIGELDTDSHLSLISEEYFDKIEKDKDVGYLAEPPVEFNGLNSTVTSKYSPILLTVQIGRCVMQNRFVVTDTLKRSPILLGSDFMIAHNMSVAPYKENEWFVTIGPLSEQISRVPAFITNKIQFNSKNEQVFGPFESKKISVVLDDNSYKRQLFKVYGCNNILKKSDIVKSSPFTAVDDKVLAKKGYLVVENRSPFSVVLPAGTELVTSELDLSFYKVKSSDPENAIEKINEDDIDPDKLEALLEPGFSAGDFIDKEKELNFIRNHSTFPNSLKEDFVSFLEEKPDLFSGEEFSKNHFPRNVYEHDVELVDPTVNSLSARPFPVAGICLQQLKTDIESLVKQGVLSPGDSPFTSPVFYVLKKPGKGKTASKGRLCFDYRRINAIIQNKNFPLVTAKNFYDNASRYKYFCVVDIQNAFLSIPLTEELENILQ
jgi:hypothetical protein